MQKSRREINAYSTQSDAPIDIKTHAGKLTSISLAAANIKPYY